MPSNTDSQPSALDVAELILQTTGPQDALKLQKLVYFCQAWSLVWRNAPLFGERIEAWLHGPVVAELYQVHSGRSPTVTVGGNAAALDADERRVVSEVLRYYGHLSPLALRRLTHDEAPWAEARRGLPDNKPSTAEITHESMRRFYSDRPCGGGRPATRLSAFSADRVQTSRRELASGQWVDLDGLGRALQG